MIEYRLWVVMLPLLAGFARAQDISVPHPPSGGGPIVIIQPPTGIGTPGLGTPGLGTPGLGTPGLGTPIFGRPGFAGGGPATRGNEGKTPPPPPRREYRMPPLVACVADGMNDDSCVRKLSRLIFSTVAPLRVFRTEILGVLRSPEVRGLPWDERRALEMAIEDTKRADALLKEGKFARASRLYASVYDRISGSSLVADEYKQAVLTAMKLADAYAALDDNDSNGALVKFDEVPAGGAGPAQRENQVAALLGQAQAHLKKRWMDAALEDLKKADELAERPDTRSVVKMMIGDALGNTKGYQDDSVYESLSAAISAAESADQTAQAHIHYAGAIVHKDVGDALSHLDAAESVCGGYAWDRGCQKALKTQIEDLRNSWR